MGLGFRGETPRHKRLQVINGYFLHDYTNLNRKPVIPPPILCVVRVAK